MRRREILLGGAAAALSGAAFGQTPAGPYSLPTAVFDKAGQHLFPAHAFTKPLPIPLTPRPTAIGTYAELTTGHLRNKAFGPGDSVPIGEAFHGVAREWGETPPHWSAYGCDPRKRGRDAWEDKSLRFGRVRSHDGSGWIRNWGGAETASAAGDTAFPIKCYRIAMFESQKQIDHRLGVSAFPARVYSYAGMLPGPTFKFRLGQPVVVRFDNQLETETSIHLHGGHSPSHSDGFPSFYVLQGKARDYFYPHILPLYRNGPGAPYQPDVGESQSSMWYHDHALDATAYNVSKGLAGFAICYGEEELGLIQSGVLPGLRERSCFDPELRQRLSDDLEDQDNPGFYRKAYGCEPYYNPYDVPLVLQDRVIDPVTGQIAYDNTGHNGYIGDTQLVNGAPWPFFSVEPRKYRFRILDGSNARVYRLRIMSKRDFLYANKYGLRAYDASQPGVEPEGESLETTEETASDAQPTNELRELPEGSPEGNRVRAEKYDRRSKPFLRIGKDSWLWSHAVEVRSMVLTMANRADIVVDFRKLTAQLKPGESGEFYLVNTMPQADGRGPKAKLDDPGDPRVLPLPFDPIEPNPAAGAVPGFDPKEHRMAELKRPIPLMKFVVDKPFDETAQDAKVEHGHQLIKTHRPIADDEIKAVREFIFERGKGAWQINGRFYDPTLANAGPILDGAEEWVLRNGGGGWWHPIHIHLEGHQLVSFEKDFDADHVVDRPEQPPIRPLGNLIDLRAYLPKSERIGVHDTMALGPNTVVRIRMRHRTWSGPFVFHCHNVEHEDMRMMFNFEPVPGRTRPEDLLPNVAPTARTHGNDVTLLGERYVGELEWDYPPVPETAVEDSGKDQIPARKKT